MVRNVCTTSRVSGENGRWAGISGRVCSSSRARQSKRSLGDSFA